MLFADIELAARIEHAECTLLSEATEAAVRRDPDGPSFVMPIAGGVAAFSQGGSPLNKFAGLGFGGDVDEGELEAIERAYAERGQPVRVELSTLGDPSVGAMLTKRGYVLQGFENALGRPLGDASAPHAATSGAIDRQAPAKDVDIAVSPDDERSEWLDVVVSGFAAPDTQGVPSDEEYPRDIIEDAIRDLTEAGGFVFYLARRAGVPAGAASMRLSDGVLQLCGATTLPEHRRRGIQSALLERRLEDATEAGATVAVVTTQPGSKSQQNVERQGFQLLYAHAVLVREI